MPLSRLPRKIVGCASAETDKIARKVIRRRWPGYYGLGDVRVVDDAAVDLLKLHRISSRQDRIDAREGLTE